MSTTEERVKEIVARQLGIKFKTANNESSFIDDLGADSLDTVELIMALEEDFQTEKPENDAEKLTTIQAVINYITDTAAKNF